MTQVFEIVYQYGSLDHSRLRDLVASRDVNIINVTDLFVQLLVYYEKLGQGQCRDYVIELFPFIGELSVVDVGLLREWIRAGNLDVKFSVQVVNGLLVIAIRHS